CAGPETAWGHRNSSLPGPKGEMFFGYFLSAAVMVADENGPPVPELARRITLAGCDHDPVRQLAAVLLRMAADGIPLGDITGDSGYAHRDAAAWAIPLRNAGAPHAAGTQPAAARRRAGRRRRPRPAGRRAGPAQTRPAHRRRRRRLPPRHLPRHRRQDPLPAPPGLNAAQPGPARDPHPARPPARLLHPADHHRPARDRGQDPPEARLPLTAMAAVLPAAQTAAERVNATIKDTATTSIARGWCRLMGLAPLTLWIACLLAIRNQRILAAYDARQQDNARRAAAGLPPRTRQRRRPSLAQLTAGPP